MSGPERHQLERRRRLTAMVMEIQRSGKLWRGGGAVSQDLYDEALAENWLWLSKNFERYDPTRASLTHWFNQNLKFRILDQIRNQQKFAKRRAGMIPTDDGWLDPIDLLPAKPITSFNLDDVQVWLEEERQRLELRHLRNRPDVTAYRVLQMKLPLALPWQEIATTVQAKVPTLSGFYQRTCLPELRRIIDERRSLLE